MIPESFFTWEQLATYGGATVATMLFVQFTKELPGIREAAARESLQVDAAVRLDPGRVAVGDRVQTVKQPA